MQQDYLQLGASPSGQPPLANPAIPGCAPGEYLDTFYLEPWEPTLFSQLFADFPDFDPGDLADQLVVARSDHGGMFGWKPDSGLRWIPREATSLADTTFLSDRLSDWPRTLLQEPLRPSGLVRAYYVPNGALPFQQTRRALSPGFDQRHRPLREYLGRADASLLDVHDADTDSVTHFWLAAEESLVKVQTSAPEAIGAGGSDTSIHVRSQTPSSAAWQLLTELGWYVDASETH